jgi:hypothetical protein
MTPTRGQSFEATVPLGASAAARGYQIVSVGEAHHANERAHSATNSPPPRNGQAIPMALSRAMQK